MTATVFPHRSALVWYGVAFALLGGCIGLMAGMSQSPVIGVLLPLLFSLIGGAGGLHLASADLDDAKARRKLLVLGVVLSAFTVCVIVASLYGVLLRTGASARSLLLRAPAEAPVVAISSGKPSSISASSELELIVLRKKLAALGATEAEQERIVAVARAALASPYSGERVAQLFVKLGALARHARESIPSEVVAIGDAKGADRAGSGISNLLGRVDHEYESMAKQIRSAVSPSLQDLRRRLESDEEQLSQLLHDDAGAEWTNKHPKAREAVWKFELALLEELARLDKGEWMTGGRVALGANELLTTLSGTSQSKSREDQPIRPAYAP